MPCRTTVLTMLTELVVVPLSVNNLLRLCLFSSRLCCLQCEKVSLLHSEALSLTYLHTYSANKGQTTGCGRTSSGYSPSSLWSKQTQWYLNSNPLGHKVSKKVLKIVVFSSRGSLVVEVVKREQYCECQVAFKSTSVGCPKANIQVVSGWKDKQAAEGVSQQQLFIRIRENKKRGLQQLVLNVISYATSWPDISNAGMMWKCCVS